MKKKFYAGLAAVLVLMAGACGNGQSAEVPDTEAESAGMESDESGSVYESKLVSLGEYKGLTYTYDSDREPTDDEVEEEMNNILLWFEDAELTDEWVKENLDFDTVEDFRVDTAKNLKDVYAQRSWDDAAMELFDQVAANSQFEMVQTDIDTLSAGYMKSYRQSAETVEMSLEDFAENELKISVEELEENCKTAASQVIEVELLADAMIEKESLNPEASYQEVAEKLANQEGIENLEEFEQAVGGKARVMREVKHYIVTEYMMEQGTNSK